MQQDVYAEVCRFKANLQDMFFAVAKQEVIFIEHVSPYHIVRNVIKVRLNVYKFLSFPVGILL